MKKRMNRIVTCVVCALVAFLITFFDVLGSVDKTVEDILYHKASGTSDKIRIIKIDDKTMNKLGDFSEWDRSVYADLMDKLCVSEDVRPAVIGFDILFSSAKEAESDKRFADACKEHGNVVCGFSYVFTKQLETDENGNLVEDTMAVEDRVVPYAALRASTEQGFVNALMDNDDSIIRSSFLYFDEEDGKRTKSFSAKIYEKYMESQGQEVKYPTDENTMSFKYSGKSAGYENVSLCDVLDGTVPAKAFDDCIVLVGAYAAGMMDAYFVPVARGEQMYGVEIHANVVQAIMEEKTLEPVPVWMDCIIAVVITILLVVICSRIGVVKIVIICLVTVVAKLVAGWFLFQEGYTWNNLTVPCVAMIIALYNIVMNYYRARMVKARIEKAFSKYVAPQVVSDIAKDGEFELRLGGENRDVAVLFVDIRGFTTLSESLQPEKVVDILNGYLELTTRSIFRHGGTLDKFIGDATMAVFNAPYDTEDYVYKAILTAWDIVQGGNRIEQEYVARYGKQVGFGVGVHCGPAVVGNIGCDFRMDYTAIGDTVNTASRLEGNAPRGSVYISSAVYERVKDRITVEEIGQIPLKGKVNGVFVYSVTGVNGYESPETNWVD